MKKIISIIFFLAFVSVTSAQDSSSVVKKYHNEFGIDATGFMKQFIYISNSQYGGPYYTPTYYLTYRRHFRTGNIRFAIGMGYTYQDINSPFEEDKNEYNANSFQFDARIGWEFFEKLSKRWEAFYGLDFRPSYQHEKNDVQFWNGGYANGYERTTETYSVSPLLGFRFRLTDRLSLTTEASFSITHFESDSRNYFTPVTDQYPEMEDIDKPKTKAMYTSFSEPLFIIITFDI